MGRKTERIKALLRSTRGKNTIIFLVFLLISSVLWVVQSLNEDVQTDLRFRINITNVPDSVTRITPLPESVNVSVRSRGTQLLKYTVSGKPVMDIDYQRYRKGNRLVMNDAQLKAYFREVIGAGTQIQSIAPDSLQLFFTSRQGVKVPVHLNVRGNQGPQMGVLRKMAALTDSVTLYSLDDKPGVKYINTAPIDVNDITESQTLKLALQAPEKCRVIPDSVEVQFEIEPMVSKSVLVDIVPVHVPQHIRIIPVPTQTEVYYMVPMSVYSSIRPTFRVEADYNSIRRDNPSKMAVHLTRIPDKYTNVFLTVDSVEYIIEQ